MAVVIAVICFIAIKYTTELNKAYSLIAATAILYATLSSIFVSYYVYDKSKLYQLLWLPILDNHNVINIHAGFDEISALIKHKSPSCNLISCDFFNAKNHTELSIKRARVLQSTIYQSIRINTEYLPFENETVDFCITFLSAHEIRDNEERVKFFKEIYRVITSDGAVFIVEHLRDWKNFLAYTIGFFHFHSKSTWLTTFKKSNLIIVNQLKITPFITVFILTKDGTSF